MSLESRYGTYFARCASSPNALMTLPSASRPLFMLMPKNGWERRCRFEEIVFYVDGRTFFQSLSLRFRLLLSLRSGQVDEMKLWSHQILIVTLVRLVDVNREDGMRPTTLTVHGGWCCCAHARAVRQTLQHFLWWRNRAFGQAYKLHKNTNSL